MNNNEIILYQSGNQSIHIEVRFKDETVWLTQAKIAELFGVKRPAITKHLKNIFISGELDEDSTCSILEHMGAEGVQKYKTKYYNLDVILSVGYRVNSINATRFRIWANKVLKDYLLKGYAVSNRIDRVESDVYLLNKKVEKIDFQIRTNLPPTEGIFYDGQIFDAYKFVTDIIKSTKQSIILIDNYVDESVLVLLSKRMPKVEAIIYTVAISKQLKLDVKRFNAQYPPIELKVFNKSHDRFLIIDHTTVYHIGASMKDLGRKWFAFSKINLSVNEMLSKLK
ncbi:MAG: DNA-binding protein [Bacteroidetes bacterium 4484_276]|nr:MAG: DNA-binding protein [Bacteroidetes bacterium 4484_276]